MPFLEERKLKSGKTSFRIIWTDGIGHRSTLKVGVVSPRIAKLRLAEVETIIAQGKDPHDAVRKSNNTRLTLSQLSQIDSDWCTGRRQPRAIQITQQSVQALINFAGDVKLSAITPITAEQFIRSYMVGRKPTTVNITVRSLKTFFRRAITIHIVMAVSPFAKVEQLANAQGEAIKYLSKEEINTLIAALDNAPRLKPLILFYLWTGARRTEAVYLPWSDVDYTSGVIHLGDPHSKTKRRRKVPLTARLISLLEELRASQPAGSAYVFSAWAKLHQSRASLELVNLRNANPTLPRWLSPHALRHTFASYLVMAGVDLSTVASILGHTTSKTTELYAHLAPSHRAAAMDKLPY